MCPITRSSNSQTSVRLSSVACQFWLLLLLLAPSGKALSLVHFDFDQKYFVHPHRQVWDFSVCRADSVYHIFYHTIHEQTPNAAYGDTIWHATSPDLKHWNIEAPILTVGPDFFDAGALWAPDIFRDPVKEKWMLAYTSCDNQMNQRISLASSDDLHEWSKVPFNPALEPDPDRYVWNPDGAWSDFRDPFVFYLTGVYHMLVTAKQNIDEPRGVLYHGVSLDLENWIDVGPMFVNDGVDPWRVLESPQYHIMNDKYFLLFGEFDTLGISAIAADTPAQFTMANRQWIDFGYAPEVDEFDEGTPIISRIAPFQVPSSGLISYVVRLDTLLVEQDGSLDVFQPHPLGEQWASWSGAANLAQPTFGDNPAMRGDPPVGLVGNGFYGSKEYYQGPLSGRGSPGTLLGDAATGTLLSDNFRIQGNRMTMLVGGGHYPETCYVALVDAETDTIIYSETGNNDEFMTLRQWDLRPHRGRLVYLEIVDQEHQEFGHINVDEIHEELLDFSPVPTEVPGPVLQDVKAYPNPFNPRTTIRFSLNRDMEVQVQVHDLRGRRVWSSGLRQGLAGENQVIWQGTTGQGRAAPAGSYIYTILLDGRVAGSGKISLVK